MGNSLERAVIGGVGCSAFQMDHTYSYAGPFVRRWDKLGAELGFCADAAITV